MNFKAKCPKCEKANKVEIDTTFAGRGDVYNDVVECECGEAFIVRTTIKAEIEVLAVAL